MLLNPALAGNAWEPRSQTFFWFGNTFPHLFALDYIKTWLWSHGCASEMQIRTASQKSAVKQEDPVWKFS